MAKENEVPSVNKSSVKIVPKGTTNQMGHSSMRLIHAFVQAAEEANIFIAK